MAVSDVGDELTVASLKNVFPWIAELVDDDRVSEIMVVCHRAQGVLVFAERAGVMRGRAAPSSA